MKESFSLSDPRYKKKDTVIEESLNNNVFSLQTIFTMISDMDGPRALSKIEEIITDKNSNFFKLDNAFKSINNSWYENHKELWRRAMVSFFKREDCPESFIKKYSSEVFLGVDKKE